MFLDRVFKKQKVYVALFSDIEIERRIELEGIEGDGRMMVNKVKE